MIEIISDRGHLRGTWDPTSKELVIKEGARTTVYHFEDDGSVSAKDYWEQKSKKIA